MISSISGGMSRRSPKKEMLQFTGGTSFGVTSALSSFSNYSFQRLFFLSCSVMKFPSLFLTEDVCFFGFLESTLRFTKTSFWLLALAAPWSLDATSNAHVSSSSLAPRPPVLYAIQCCREEFFNRMSFLQVIFRLLQCCMIFPVARLCPKYFQSYGGISIFEVTPHLKWLSNGL